MKVGFIDVVHPILWERLTSIGLECIDCSDWSVQVCLDRIGEFEGLVIRSRFKLTSEVLSKASNLQFIARAGSGLENIDRTFCAQNDITVFSSPEGNRDAVAEQVVGMLLMLQNHLKRADHEVRNGIWKRAENRGTEIKGKTIALIGCGTMAKATAQRLSGFEAQIIAYDPFIEQNRENLIPLVDLPTVFEQADIVSLHMNYRPDNHYFVNKSFLEQFKKPIVLINTARGRHVKTGDLVEAIKNGKVAGACLDVLEFESTSFEGADLEDSNFTYLKQSDRVILSPHIAGWTHESHVKLSSVLADKIEAWLK